MTQNRGLHVAALILLSILSQPSISEAGDTPITPIPTECPATNSPNYTVHLQHESDCTKFYKCDWGKKVLFDCPATLHFNPLLQVCDWPDRAGCTLGQSSSSPEPPTTSSRPSTSSNRPSPTPPPNRDPECPWPDPLNYTVHLPHENDCTKFYKCDNGVKVEFTCPDDLHFNRVLEVCDWPRDAGCESNPNTPPSTAAPPSPTPPPNRDPECPWPDPLNYTVHLPHENDCTKFYKCDNGVKVEFDCPDDLHFNKVLEVCDWPRDAGCESNPNTPPSTAAPPSPTAAPPSPTPPPNRDPECPWPDPLNYTVHLPHENDCTKFYKCDNGVKVEFDCPDDLHFNKVLEVCDWPRDAGCESNPNTPPSTAAPPSPTAAPPSPTPPPNRDPECPWPDPLNYTVHLPHENDCTKFYKCDNGVKVEFDCPDDLHFNKVLEVCDWPRDAGCESNPNTPPSTAAPPSPTAAPPSPTPPPNRDPECPWPDPLNYTVHLPHENDCTKFYKCDNGVKVEFDCPDDLHFNKVLEVCDWPRNAGCETNPNPPSSTPPPPSSTAAPPSPTAAPPSPTPPPNRDPECPWPDPLNYTVHLPHENDCTKFYKCDNGVKVEFTCPDDLHFNRVLEVCDWPRNSGCESNPNPPPSTDAPPSPTAAPPSPTPPPNRDPECPWPDPLNYTVHLPHENDCTKFYKCDHGVKVEFDCPDGLHFNKVLQVCDWPETAGCKETPEPPRPPEPEPGCPADSNAVLPHECECNKFYRCEDGEKVLYDCPEGQLFNANTNECDNPENVDCNRTSPVTDIPTNPTTEDSSSATTPSSTTDGNGSSATDDITPSSTTDGNGSSATDDTTPSSTTDGNGSSATDDTTPSSTTDGNGSSATDDTTPSSTTDGNGSSATDDTTPSSTTDGNGSSATDDTTPSSTTDGNGSSATDDITTPTPTTDGDTICPQIDCDDVTRYLPVLSNPRQYLRCVKGVEVLETCPSNLVFDKELATCNLEHIVG